MEGAVGTGVAENSRLKVPKLRTIARLTGSWSPCVPRDSKSAHQRTQNTQAGILSLSFG